MNEDKNNTCTIAFYNIENLFDTVDDIGTAVVFMASPASSWITGQCLYVAGGM